ncbi:hypothetical protein E2R62_02425 [Citrobacter rodentium]|uniref:Uncharacterized protein n=1 Tax=Citrobacter rodentium TaxID=67825 RepID=A0A482PC38_CITRO|nr:hypothetical protein E2R62_02425 [Citrobacter rodentium]HAT8012932.1 hypothetical protein [Citrobacter rodentium NBRC 105723 = DSM 16636]HAT8018976.1 hypothetical protein [Citrobacter rodentium]HAT8028199.1 hypothetical protein [Citrobacter rodentium]HAT8032876.1 hypothetical protein [Citrobacter rodentium]
MFSDRHGESHAISIGLSILHCFGVDFSGFRGAALNQSRSVSGVYIGLLCWHKRCYRKGTMRKC